MAVEVLAMNMPMPIEVRPQVTTALVPNRCTSFGAMGEAMPVATANGSVRRPASRVE